MKILVICMAVFSLSQGFPRPSSNNDNTGDRRQGVHYGYPENPSEPYTSNQATAYSSDPADTNLDTTNPSWSEPVQSTTADQQSTADNQNTVADQSSAQETTTPSSNAGSQSQNTERQTETSQAQATQTESQASDTSTSTQTQTQASTSQTKDSASTGTQTVAPQTATQSPSYQDSNSASSQVSTPASTAQTTTQTQTPQTQDATAANHPQTSTYDSQSSTQSPSQTAQDSTSTSSQSQTYNQNKASNDYVNPPQTYNAGENDQNNPQSDTPSQTASQTPKTSYNPQGNDVPDNTQYQVENVTSKIVPDSDQAKPSSPVYLSSTATANVADSSNPDDKKKSPTFSKETVVHGNHAVTYLELPKHLHKPAIVKYQVQIAPKVKGVPIEQEIAIMPPEGAGGERKPLVLLKQVVSKPTDERIQVIVPKSESSSVNTPKVEVKGGHVDQEALNSQGQGQYQGQGQSQGQGLTQGESQSQDQSQGQYQDQPQSQGQYQDQPQGQDQYQGQGQPQGQGQYQSQDQYQGQNEGAAESQDVACGDHSACTIYNPNMCNQVWMKRHCKKMCGLCAPQDEETPFSSSLSEETSAQEPCEYSGVVHQSGETWSPGPCVPKCHCDNGHIKCSRLECPDLNCAKPVKRRWKCCPECLPNSDNETRCGVETTGGNGENLCCVFPFNYRGVDYFTCTTADAQEPWCSITRNYDRDGLWGNCVVKSKTGKKHTKLADSDEKTALVLAAQLSSAREWRNSTNNQVTDTLKGMPSPLSEDDLQKLRDKDSDANKVYQNASGVSSDISAQAEYYRKAEVDPAQIAALNNARKSYNNNEAYQRNSTLSVTSPVTSSLTSSATTPLGTSQATSLTSSVTPASSSSTQAVYNNTYNPSNSYAQPTGDSYPYQTTAHPNDKASEVVGTYSDPGVQANQVSYAGESNAGGSTTVGPNTGGSNTEDSQYRSYYGGANNQSSTGAYSGGSYEKGSTANDTYSGSYRQESATKDTTANYPSSVSSYSDSYGQESTAKDTADNYPSGATYTGSYGQGSTAKDTTDNTVPNGIENQTSYEMHPDASTAQYGNNQLATT